MEENKIRKAPQNSEKVLLTEPWEIDYWTKELNTSERTLREAMRKVGDSVEKVRLYLMSR